MTLRELIKTLTAIAENDLSSDEIFNVEVKVKVDRYINPKDTVISVIRDSGKPTLIIINASHEED